MIFYQILLCFIVGVNFVAAVGKTPVIPRPVNNDDFVFRREETTVNDADLTELTKKLQAFRLESGKKNDLFVPYANSAEYVKTLPQFSSRKPTKIDAEQEIVNFQNEETASDITYKEYFVMRNRILALTFVE